MAPNRFIRKEVIKRDDGTPYLIRWHILHTRFGRVMLHKIILPDLDCPHDHPWNFTSFILWGGYIDWVRKPHMLLEYFECPAICLAPTMVRHKAEDAHRLELFPIDGGARFKPCWTLVFTSTYRRKWGFWTKRGWVRHNDYKSINSCE